MNYRKKLLSMLSAKVQNLVGDLYSVDVSEVKDFDGSLHLVYYLRSDIIPPVVTHVGIYTTDAQNLQDGPYGEIPATVLSIPCEDEYHGIDLMLSAIKVNPGLRWLLEYLDSEHLTYGPILQ